MFVSFLDWESIYGDFLVKTALIFDPTDNFFDCYFCLLFRWSKMTEDGRDQGQNIVVLKKLIPLIHINVI